MAQLLVILLSAVMPPTVVQALQYSEWLIRRNKVHKTMTMISISLNYTVQQHTHVTSDWEEHLESIYTDKPTCSSICYATCLLAALYKGASGSPAESTPQLVTPAPCFTHETKPR
eukprot:5228739-Amphidinium_carterae.1